MKLRSMIPLLCLCVMFFPTGNVLLGEGLADQALTRDSFKKAIQIAAPSVVTIIVERPSGYSPVDPVGPQEGNSSGTGFVADTEGYIITNNHVAGTATPNLKVVFPDGTMFPAVLVGSASNTDVSILKIDVPKEYVLTPAEFRDSDTVEAGEIVVAVGSPIGLRNTATQGIVSAIRRIELPETQQRKLPPHSIIQTDAAINPGNSGGPLVDLDGKVIGMNTFIFSPSGGSIGLGFAIPGNVAKTVYERVKSGNTEQGWIGITVQELDSDVRRSFGIPKDAHCVLVTGVDGASPAEVAGLRQGDCIEAIDGKPYHDPASLGWLIQNSVPGSELAFSVLRRSNPAIVVRVIVAKKETP